MVFGPDAPTALPAQPQPSSDRRQHEWDGDHPDSLQQGSGDPRRRAERKDTEHRRPHRDFAIKRRFPSMRRTQHVINLGPSIDAHRLGVSRDMSKQTTRAQSSQTARCLLCSVVHIELGAGSTADAATIGADVPEGRAWQAVPLRHEEFGEACDRGAALHVGDDTQRERRGARQINKIILDLRRRARRAEIELLSHHVAMPFAAIP